EMENRLAKLRSEMETEKVDAVFFTSIHNINYYNHFVYCSFGRPYGLVVTQDKLKSITANIDGGQPWRRGFGDNIIFTDWERDNYFRAIQHEIANSRRVGIEYDHINLENLKKLQDALPDAELVDISKMTMRQRMVKSAEEIELIRNGAKVGDIGGAACVEAIGEGVPEHEVALHSTRTMVREIAKRYPESDIMDTWTWFQSGINTDGAHNPVSTRKIQKGDILSLNCFPMIGGYYTALERTLFFDHASERHLEIWEANVEVHRRGLELIKPGVRCCDIAEELNEIFIKHDLLQYRTFGYGHSFGTLSHYYGREAGLELREDIETVLEPNMVVSIEPMVMLPETLPGAGGYREHDILVVTEDGAENITGFPFGPEYNIIS
ncbi:MAG TPA: M24 family metallopeptidase, partial [Candidatus Marinimicrobia bacterium]|nr:M24 family metallopeptidase [Candidatus Neomarinimicrobiota bacterium]